MTGHVIGATKITKIVRDGRAGITPNKHVKKRKAGEVDSSEPVPCDGIRAAGSIGKARTYFPKSLRKASAFVAGPDFEARLQSAVKEEKKSLFDFITESEATIVCIENGECVIRAKSCDGVAATSFGRCAACESMRSGVSSAIFKCRPADKDVHEIKDYTNIRYIAADPKLADFETRRVRKRNHVLCKNLLRARATAMFKEKTIKIKDAKIAKLMDKALSTACAYVDAGPYRTDDNGDACDLLKIYYEHVHKNQKYYTNGVKKNGGFRCHPLLFQFAVMVLAKTSHSVYEQLANVMCLPSLSCVSFHCHCRRNFVLLYHPLLTQ